MVGLLGAIVVGGLLSEDLSDGLVVACGVPAAEHNVVASQIQLLHRLKADAAVPTRDYYVQFSR